VARAWPGRAETVSGRAENLRYARFSRLVLRVRQWLAAADPRPHAREELGHTALRFVASVALTCTGRVAGWAPGRVWGAELRTLRMLQVREVTPAIQVAGRPGQEARDVPSRRTRLGRTSGNGQLSSLMAGRSVSAPGSAQPQDIGMGSLKT
jgi:hypothetical protein